MSVSSLSNAANQVVGFARTNAPTMATPSQMAKNIQKIALPVIVLAGMMTLTVVLADRCTDCMNSCDAIGFELFKLACYAFCVFGPACK